MNASHANPKLRLPKQMAIAVAILLVLVFLIQQQVSGAVNGLLRKIALTEPPRSMEGNFVSDVDPAICFYLQRDSGDETSFHADMRKSANVTRKLYTSFMGKLVTSGNSIVKQEFSSGMMREYVLKAETNNFTLLDPDGELWSFVRTTENKPCSALIKHSAVGLPRPSEFEPTSKMDDFFVGKWAMKRNVSFGFTAEIGSGDIKKIDNEKNLYSVEFGGALFTYRFGLSHAYFKSATEVIIRAKTHSSDEYVDFLGKLAANGDQVIDLLDCDTESSMKIQARKTTQVPKKDL